VPTTQYFIPQSINLWLGRAAGGAGASSGLHHDFHDNLYCLPRGSNPTPTPTPTPTPNPNPAHTATLPLTLALALTPALTLTLTSQVCCVGARRSNSSRHQMGRTSIPTVRRAASTPMVVVRVSPNPDPDLDPEPDPDPDPDPDPGPSSGPRPDPDPNPSPSPSPDPNQVRYAASTPTVGSTTKVRPLRLMSGPG
jgi:hypothetical protein